MTNIFVERLWRSVKNEDVYLKGYGTMGELLTGLRQYFTFYNGQQMHQALQYKTPNEVYASAGGALIVDKFPREETGSPAKTGAAPPRCAG